MKIFLLNDKFFPEVTGIGGYVKSLAEKFLAKGHVVWVVTTTLEKEKEGIEKDGQLMIYRIFTKSSHYLRNYFQIYNPKISQKIKILLQKEKPDICHFFNVHERLSYYLLKISSRYSRVTIWHARDVMSFSYKKLTHYVNAKVTLENFKKETYKLSFWDLWNQAGKSFNPLRNLFIRYYLRFADGRLSVSNALREAMMINGVSQDIAIGYSGIEANFYNNIDEKEIFSFKEKYGLRNKKVLLFSGRMSYEKGSWAAMHMLEEVVKKRNDVVLFVAAKKDFYGDKLLNYAASRGIDKNIIISGWLDRSEMRLAYCSTNIVLSPSVCLDAFPKINLEAMAAKKPVVGTCFGGTPEIVVDGETGFIVNPLDTARFSEKVLELLNDEEKARQFGLVGFKRVTEKFNLDTIIDELLNYYINFLNKK